MAFCIAQNSMLNVFQVENVLISDKKVGELVHYKKLPIQENENLILDNWFKVQLIKEQASCPKCKIGTVKKGKTAWGCTLYGAGCDYLVAF